MVSALLGATAPREVAAQATWAGTAANTNWSTTANWLGTAPTNNSSRTYVFTGGNGLSNTNDLTSGTATSITFNSSGFALSGNALTLGGSITNNITSGTNTIGLNMAIGSSDRTITGSAGSTLVLSGNISGAAGLVTGRSGASGTSNFVLSGLNTTSGTITLSASTKLVLGGTAALGTGTLRARSGSTLDVSGGPYQFANTLLVDNSGGALTFLGSQSLSFTGTTLLGTGNLTVSVSANTLTLRSLDNQPGIASAGLFTKSGSGSLVITDAAAGGFSRSSIILNGGSLEVGNGSALGSGTLTLTSGTFQTSSDLTIANPIVGGASVLGGVNSFTLSGPIVSGPLNKAGNNTVTLSGSNSYTGITAVNAGVLLLNSANALPGGIGSSGGTSNLQLGIAGGQNDGVVGLTTGTFARNYGAGSNQINMQYGGGFAAYAAGQAVNLGGLSGTQQWGQSSFLNAAGAILVLGANDATHAIDFQNPLNLSSPSAARTIKVNNGQSNVDAIMSGVISNGGSGGLTKTGSGVLSLTAANTYTGTTTISAGTLQIGNNGASGSIQASSPVSLSADAALAFNRLDNYGGNFANAITGSGLVRLLSGSLTLSGSNNYSGGTEVTGGRLTAGHANAFGTSGITISAGALDLANLSISNAITNNGGVLTGLAAYSGTQSVSGLTSLSGNVGGTVNVLSSGTLKGSNTNFTGAVAIATGGVHSPGSSPGVQTFESGITYDTGSTLAWELVNNTTTGAGTAYDIVNVTGGSLSIASGALLQLEFQNTGLVSSAVDWTNSFWDSTQSWTIVDFSSNTGNSTGDFTLLGSSSTWLDKYGVSLATARNNDATFQLSKVNGDVVLTYVIVPEPDTIIFAGIGIALAGWTVWKRRRIAQITARTK